MKLFTLLQIAFALLVLPGQSHSFSLDASALSSDLTKQIQVNAAHIHETPGATLEVGGKYAKTQHNPVLYEVFLANETRLPHNIRIESDVRRLQSHDTFSGGAGYGYQALSVTAGVRVEYKDGRDSFGNLKTTLKTKRGNFAITATGEALHNGDDGRIDYRAAAKYQIKLVYVAFRVERVRGVGLQGISLGVKL